MDRNIVFPAMDVLVHAGDEKVSPFLIRLSEPEVQPHGRADDLGWKPKSGVAGAGGHRIHSGKPGWQQSDDADDPDGDWHAEYCQRIERIASNRRFGPLIARDWVSGDCP
jgi:hypothetical protein